MMGRRTKFFVGWPKELAQPGDYCKVPPGIVPGCDTDCWFLKAPDGSMCRAGRGTPLKVTEHEDGTITVQPSVVTPSGWHGWLIRGLWS